MVERRVGAAARVHPVFRAAARDRVRCATLHDAPDRRRRRHLVGTDTRAAGRRGGSIFNRRHVPHLIRAFAPIARAHADASLDIVGDDRTYPHEDLPAAIASEGLQRQVRWHQYVTDDQLRGLYASARAFAFLSEY